MKIIAVISQKGGAGKTTLAVNLAVAAELQDVPTVLIDLDPQSSAKTWHDLRANKEAPFVVSSQASRLEEVMGAACAPAILDLKAIGSSGDLAALAKKEALVVLNAVPHQGKLAEEAEEAVRSYGLSVAPVKLTQRAAYVHSLTGGQAAQEFEPGGKAAQEIAELYKWAYTRVHASTLETVRKSA
jgi:chromosome partitioning protein